MNDYSKQIANKLVSHMEEKEYRYEFDREKGLLKLNFNINSNLGKVRFVLDIHSCFYISYGCIDMNVKEEQRAEVVEFITRANYGLNFGNFEMDMRDGEIRYKCTVDCDHCMLSDEMIGTSLVVPVNMYERYGDQLLKVMFGMMGAKEAVEIAESEN